VFEADESRRMRRRLNIAMLLPLLAAALLVLVFLRTMGHSAERLAGSNSVPPERLVVQIGRGTHVCQQILVPHDAASARFFVSTLGAGAKGPPFSMRLDDNGRTLATSRVAGGWTGDKLDFHFPTLTRTYLQARICVRDEGRGIVRFQGLATGQPTSTLVNGKPEYAAISIVFFRPGKSDAWSLLPTIAQRAGVLKGALAGGWSFWFAAALVLIAGAAAIALSLRGRRA
jgi:hypothetical protein